MPQSLAQVYLHIVFSTKNRSVYFQDENRRCELFSYLAGICSHRDCFAKQVGGYVDHVHILCSLSRTKTIADLVTEIKTGATDWIKTNWKEAAKFSWQNGYSVFSVSQSQLEKVKQYIISQEEHHRKKTYQDELRRLLELNQTKYDEQYVWD